MRNATCGLALVAVLVLGLAGCIGGNITPEDKVKLVSKNIRIGTASVTAIGLVAIPDEIEAEKIAKESLKVLEENVLPLLNGEEAALIRGLARLRDLSVFDKPELAKLKLILETALPLLEKNLPDDLLEQGLKKVPADVKSYMVAFFEGVHEGVKAYLGDEGGLRGGGKYGELRKKLAN